MNKYIIISILLLSSIFLLGCTEQDLTIPYSTSQFVYRTTDLNYTDLSNGVYDGNCLAIDGNKIAVTDCLSVDANIPWDTLIDFPSGCGVGQAVKVVGTTLVCIDLTVDTNFETAGFTADDINNALVDLTGYVPYQNATTDVNLGSNNAIANSFRADAHEQTISASEQTITQTGQSSVALTLGGGFANYTVGSTNPVFSDGTQIGQVMVVKVVDYGFVNTVTIKDDSANGKVNLQGDKTFFLTDDILIVYWTGSLWQEVYRNLGVNNEFTGTASGWGIGNDFSGYASGWGNGNEFSGEAAGWGYANVANAYQAVFGRWSTDQGDITVWVATDDLVKIGIGTSIGARADGFRMLKNGESHWETDQKHHYGLGNDSYLQYDGNKFLLNPKAVGSGVFNVQGDVLIDEDLNVTQNLRVDGNVYYKMPHMFGIADTIQAPNGTGVWKAIDWNFDLGDSYGFTAQDINGLIVSDTGHYFATMEVQFQDHSPSPAADVAIRITKNGSEVSGSYSEVDTVRQDASQEITTIAYIEANAGDVLQLQWVTSDIDVNIQSDNTYATQDVVAKGFINWVHPDGM